MLAHWNTYCWLARQLRSLPGITQGSPADVEADTENIAGVSKTKTGLLKTPVYGSKAHTERKSQGTHTAAAGNEIILLGSGSEKNRSFEKDAANSSAFG